MYRGLVCVKRSFVLDGFCSCVSSIVWVQQEETKTFGYRFLLVSTEFIAMHGTLFPRQHKLLRIKRWKEHFWKHCVSFDLSTALELFQLSLQSESLRCLPSSTETSAFSRERCAPQQCSWHLLESLFLQQAQAGFYTSPQHKLSSRSASSADWAAVRACTHSSTQIPEAQPKQKSKHLWVVVVLGGGAKLEI